MVRLVSIFTAFVLPALALSAGHELDSRDSIPRHERIHKRAAALYKEAAAHVERLGARSSVPSSVATPLPIAKPRPNRCKHRKPAVTSSLSTRMTTSRIAKPTTVAPANPGGDPVPPHPKPSSTWATPVGINPSDVKPTHTKTFAPPPTPPPPTTTKHTTSTKQTTVVKPTPPKEKPTTTHKAVAPSQPATNNGGGGANQYTQGTHSGQGTYYAPGLGACGITNSASDYIAAVSHILYDEWPGATANPNKNPICGRKVTAEYKGKSVTVSLADRCVSCAEYDLDFSPAAFDQLADESLGRIDITWRFD